jgi:hypothetical protein
LWQNRMNYSGSSALVIAVQPILTQAPQTEQSVGLSGLRPIQPRFNRIEAGLPRTKASLQSQYSSSLLIYTYANIIANLVKLKVYLYKQCLNRQAKQLVHAHSGRKINTRLHTSQRLTPCSAQGLVSLRRVTASRGWIPLHGPAMWNRSWPRRTICGVLEGYT